MIYRIHILVLFLLLFYYTVHPAPAEMSELTKAVLATATGNRRPNIVEGKSCLSVCLSHTQAHFYAGEGGAAMGRASAEHGSLHQLR